MGRLTTHVLDTANGCPAAGMAFLLLKQGAVMPITSGRTNAEGRCESPLLQGDYFTAGHYELRFLVAEYFRTKGVELPDPPFLDVVTIAFGIANPDAHYHVPLLVSPWSYSTYRGS